MGEDESGLGPRVFIRSLLALTGMLLLAACAATFRSKV
jgi:hypothetical protein